MDGRRDLDRLDAVASDPSFPAADHNAAIDEHLADAASGAGVRS